ncbi:MAG: repair protein recO [Actinomycetota bacterium]|jgi:DNA repair protein RecO (recombination protein O)
MPSYRAEAIVLRTHKLGEADRIITFLTRERGKVRAVAKGVRRTKSKFGARLEPFSRVDLLLHEGKNLHIITQAESLNAYGQDLAIDYTLWTAGQTMLETADRLVSEESVANEAQYLLLVGALRTLVNGEHDSTLVLDAYLLRALSLAGYSPTLDACIVCGMSGAQPFFHVPSGGALCFDHRAPGSVAPKAESIQLMQALLEGDWQSADQATGSQKNEVSGIVAAYTQWHMDKTLRSLPLVDRIR